MAKEDRGFASMDRAKQREIAQQGRQARRTSRAPRTSGPAEEARQAGRKGGMASHEAPAAAPASPKSRSFPVPRSGSVAAFAAQPRESI